MVTSSLHSLKAYFDRLLSQCLIKYQHTQSTEEATFISEISLVVEVIGSKKPPQYPTFASRLHQVFVLRNQDVKIIVKINLKTNFQLRLPQT